LSVFCPPCSGNGAVLPDYYMVSFFGRSVALPAVVMAQCCLTTPCCLSVGQEIACILISLKFHSFLGEVAVELYLKLFESRLQPNLPSKSRYRQMSGMWQTIHNSVNEKLLLLFIIYLSCSWATCRPVPVSRIQKSPQMSAMIPSASWTVVFHYPG